MLKVYQQGFEANVPLVETQIFSPYLQRILTKKGIAFKEAVTSLKAVALHCHLAVLKLYCN